MRRITPHLCNLLSANQFFDTLKVPAFCGMPALFCENLTLLWTFGQDYGIMRLGDNQRR